MLISFGCPATARSLDGSATIRPRAAFPSTERVPQTSGVPQSPTTFWGRRCSWPVHPSRCLHDTRRYALEYPNSLSAEEFTRCRNLISVLGLEAVVEWHTDFLPDETSLSLLAECDLVVLPYDNSSESSSAAVRAAIASRASVAVTPVSIFDAVADLGFRFDGLDVQSIVNSVNWILNNPEARQAVGNRVETWIKLNSWEAVAERLHGMLTGLVAQSSDDAWH